MTVFDSILLNEMV